MHCEGNLELRSLNTSYCLIEVGTKAGLTYLIWTHLSATWATGPFRPLLGILAVMQKIQAIPEYKFLVIIQFAIEMSMC